MADNEKKISKVVYFDETLIDLTDDTVSANTLLNGVTAHDASGQIITGSLEPVMDVIVNGTSVVEDGIAEVDAAPLSHTHSYNDLTNKLAAGNNISIENNSVSVDGVLPIINGGTNGDTAQAAFNNLANGISAGDSGITVFDTDYIISNLHNNNETVTTAWRKRTMADFWLWIKSKADSLYATISHNHSATDITSGTLPIARGGTGGTTGQDAIDNLVTAVGAGTVGTPPSDDDYILTNYHSTSGTDQTKWRKRLCSDFWSYIKSKADDVYVPKTRTVNSKALSSNISLSYADILSIFDAPTIPDGTDLNTYITPGVYKTTSTTKTATLVNCPVTEHGIVLIVEYGTSTNIIVQTVYDWTNRRTYSRGINTGTNPYTFYAWSTWAVSDHTHSNYYSSSTSRTANTVLAAPKEEAGSATFRKLVAADLPTVTIAKGGTGSTTATGAVSNLGIKDYVVAQSLATAANAWSYRKWNSGYLEVFGCFTATVASWAAWGSCYEGKIWTSKAYPTAVPFTKILSFEAFGYTAGQGAIMGTEAGHDPMSSTYLTKAPDIFLIRPEAAPASQTFGISITVKGRWK